MASAESISDPAAGWDEAQCTAALAQMEQLQAQIDDLRLAIPRIIEPFHLPSKPSTFKLYAQGVERAQNGVKEFHESWRSPATERIFEHVRKSQTANTDLSAATSIPDHGWIAREKRERKLRDGGQNEILEKRVSLSREDITRAVSDAQKSHPEIKFTLQDNDDIISIRFIASAVKLNFKISVEREANGNHSLNAECLGTTELSRTITRCIASRPQAEDFNYLIDMIIAYKTVKGTSCAACAKFLDNAAVVPTARRRKQQLGASETPEPVWEALHERCL